MSKFLGLLSIFLISGCSIIMDPLNTSIADVTLAREQSDSKIVNGSVDEVREKIKEQITLANWRIYQDLPKKDCFVVINIPGAIDTTDVGIFITQQESDKVLVQVSSLNRVAQSAVSERIFSNL